MGGGSLKSSLTACLACTATSNPLVASLKMSSNVRLIVAVRMSVPEIRPTPSTTAQRR